jgi:hypothetical protein
MELAVLLIPILVVMVAILMLRKIIWGIIATVPIIDGNMTSQMKIANAKRNLAITLFTIGMEP